MKVLLFANTDWYLYRFRMGLAQALRDHGHEVVLVSPYGAHVEHFPAMGFRWIRFDFSRSGINVAGESGTLARLMALYQRERPDLVHHFTIKCVLYGSFCARITGVPAIVNSITGMGHVFISSGWPAALLRRFVSMLYQRLLKGTDVIFENPDDLASFRAMGMMSAARAHVIRGVGVDTAHFRPPAEPSRKGRRILLAARLLWSKGVGEYLEAARMVRQSVPDAVFLLAGSHDPGNPAAIPVDMVETWSEIEWLGHCDDMAPLLASVDLVVLPSYREGTPTVLLEAAAAGLPLVASDVPGCREVVMDGANGFLVPARDASGLARAIVLLLQDDSLRARMGQHSRVIACREFAREKIVRETLAVYQKTAPC